MPGEDLVAEAAQSHHVGVRPASVGGRRDEATAGGSGLGIARVLLARFLRLVRILGIVRVRILGVERLADRLAVLVGLKDRLPALLLLHQHLPPVSAKFWVRKTIRR